MNLWLYSLRDMAKRPGRSLLTLLSIVLGVGTVFAVSTTITGAKFAYGRMTETLTGNADAEIVARGGGHFAQKLVDSVETNPTVENAVPLLYQFALLNTGRSKIQINGIGTILAKQRLFRPFELVSGRLLENEQELVLEKSLADSVGIKAGDEVKIVTRRNITPQKMMVVGLIRPTEVWAFTQGGLAYFELADWQWWCKAEGKIDVLQIALKPAVDKETALKAIADGLPAELQLQSSKEAGTPTSETFIAFQLGLESTRALALAVAALLILNTFLMNVTERRGQIAVMRLVGATRWQIMGLLLREGALVGVLGAVLGLPLGWLLAHGLAKGMENAFAVALRNPELGLGPTLFAFAMGPVLAMVAVLIPALQAARIKPLENLRASMSAPGARRNWLYPVVGALLVGFSVFGISLSLAHILPRGWAASMALLFLGGVLLLFPLVLRPAYALPYYLLRFLGPMEFELAFRQMIRNRGRSLLTWGILFIAVATSVGTGLILSDVIEPIRDEVRRTTFADFIVRATNTNLATGSSASVPEELAAQVKRLEGVQSVEAMAILNMGVSPAGKVNAVVREFDLYEQPPLKLTNVNPAEIRDRLLHGEVVLSDILAYKLQLKAGDTIKVEYEGKSHGFRVASTSPFFLAGGLAFFIDRKIAERTFGSLGTDALLINAQPGQSEALAQRLRALTEERSLLFQTYAELQDRLQSILNTVVASLWILLALGFIIAVFGVTNTLMMNILEQTREIGLMRVLGMQRRQIRRMVLAQSAYVGVVGILPGLAVGVLLAYVIRSTTLAIFGQSPNFGVLLPWLGPYALGLLILVLLFGWLPAARGARLNILDSIRTE
jgi:putative ABC transport system permease protein